MDVMVGSFGSVDGGDGQRARASSFSNAAQS
jgi:hypothetical protein